MTDPDHAASERLTLAVRELRDVIRDSRLPLDLESTAGAEADRQALLHQVDDYLLPRLDSLDAPLLAVVGGSTGAGKSTLVNSLLGDEVSRMGALRPTTTVPVLIHHPDDARWFKTARILPELSRVTGTVSDNDQPGTVRLVDSRALPSGLALLDAPDIDSVVRANRTLSAQLLLAADMWLFVTTAARYADAVPWDLLRAASERGTAVAIVLDRIDADDIAEVRPHLVQLLRERGLGTAPIFTVEESVLTDAGLLPEAAMSRLKGWLTALAEDGQARSMIVSQTLSGALASIQPRVEALAVASQIQHDEGAQLAEGVHQAFADALEAVEAGMSDGTLLRGEVLARWHDFVGTGDFFRQVESTISKLRDKVASVFTGNPVRAEDVDEALQDGVASLIQSQAQFAIADIARQWRTQPAGATLLVERPTLEKSTGTFPSAIERLVRDWQGDVLSIVSSEGKDRRTNAKIAAYGVNGIGVFLMLVSFAHTGGLVGAEVGIAGGTAVLAQKVLEAIFGDQAVREMSKRARETLIDRVGTLYADEEARYRDAVDAVLVPAEQAGQLRAAAKAVKAAA